MSEELIKKVSLTDVLSEETINRGEENSVVHHKEPEEEEIEVIVPTEVESSSSNDDFDPPLTVIQEESSDSQDPIESEEEEFDAEESAESAIDVMDVLQQTILMPIAAIKLQKRYGGKEKIKEMRAAANKALKKMTLSKEEEELASLWAAYDSKLSEIREEIPFDATDVAALKPGTIKFCEKNGIKVNENLAFGAGMVKVLSPRIISLIMI